MNKIIHEVERLIAEMNALDKFNDEKTKYVTDKDGSRIRVMSSCSAE